MSATMATLLLVIKWEGAKGTKSGQDRSPIVKVFKINYELFTTLKGGGVDLAEGPYIKDTLSICLQIFLTNGLFA